MQVQTTEMGGPAYRGRRSERTQSGDESNSNCESTNIIQVHVGMIAIKSMPGRPDFGAQREPRVRRSQVRAGLSAESGVLFIPSAMLARGQRAPRDRPSAKVVMILTNREFLAALLPLVAPD